MLCGDLNGKEIWKRGDIYIYGFPSSSDGKASAGNEGDLGSIPGLGISPEKEMATHSSIRAWKLPWTEDPGRLQSMGSKMSDMTERLTFTSN